MLPVRWIEEALLEAEQAAGHYTGIDLELGNDWWAKLRAQLALADGFPGAGKRVARVQNADVKRYLFERFPYAIVLVRFTDELVVVAVHHQRRKPGYWKPRLVKVRR